MNSQGLLWKLAAFNGYLMLYIIKKRTPTSCVVSASMFPIHGQTFPFMKLLLSASLCFGYASLVASRFSDKVSAINMWSASKVSMPALYCPAL